MKTAVLEVGYLSALCHDLRGPLGAIGTWVHVLGLERADEATRSQALAAMSRDIAAQGNILDQVSELAALTAGPNVSAPVAIELTAFVKAMLAAGLEGAPPTLKGEEPGPTVMADAKALRRLVALLIGGAVHVRPGNLLELRIGPAGSRTEVVVEAEGTPRVVTVALVRALAEFQNGTFEVTVNDGRTILRLTLPSL